MRFVKASPNEYLVVARKGRLVDRGIAGSAFLWPGMSHARIPSTKQEALFTMLQETSDGIPLRFKGIVIYRIVDPVAATQQFDFVGEDGHEVVKELLAHVCLGELRAKVAHMTMTECVEQRKTTLTETVGAALAALLEQNATTGDGPGWGLELDVVQVAQVFIVDEELRRDLEAKQRNRIRATSQLSALQTEEELRRAREASTRILEREELETAREQNAVAREKLLLKRDLEQEEIESEKPVELLRIATHEETRRARIASDRALEEEGLETERQRNEAERERARLAEELERERIETESPVRKLRLARTKEELETELEMRTLEREVEAIRVEKQMLEPTAAQALRKDILPIEQTSEVAESLSRMFRGTNLTLYGEDGKLLGAIAPVLDQLGRMLRSGMEGQTDGS